MQELPARPPQTAARWVSIRRACEILGVNQATLRNWTDDGRVRAYLTPGGHRRYQERELQAMTERVAQRSDAPSLESLMLRSRERYESLARQCLGSSPWFQSFDADARLRFRILGNSMLHLLASFVMASSRHERQRCLQQGREVATQHGIESAELGLSLTQATEAFLLFRNPVLECVTRWVSAPQGHAQVGEVLKRVNYFMDQVLVTMAAAHERRRSAHTNTGQAS